jgi:cytosine/adenosine deaminase-related metal-dependent hydrolase
MILRGVELVGESKPAREIVVSGASIARVGGLSARLPDDGPLVELDEAIVFPGLTNSHDHLEFNVYPSLGHERYGDYVDWGHDIHRRDATVIAALERIPHRTRLRWGALKNLLCGVTTVAHHGSARDDLTELPIDTVVATSIHSVGLDRRWAWKLNAPIARSPYVFHLGEGTSLFAKREIDELLRWNLFRRPLIAVHAIAMRAEQASHFRAIVWCPVSNESLYGVTADIASLKPVAPVLFGTDSTLTADWNVWNHLRRARALGDLDDPELFAAVTRSAAVVWGRAKTGSVAPGQNADLVVARKKAKGPYDAFFAVEPQDILLVLRRGQVVLHDASLGLPVGRGPLSMVGLGGSEKWVAEDVPAVLAGMREYGVEPNLPITVPCPSTRRVC